MRRRQLLLRRLRQHSPNWSQQACLFRSKRAGSGGVAFAGFAYTVLAARAARPLCCIADGILTPAISVVSSMEGIAYQTGMSTGERHWLICDGQHNSTFAALQQAHSWRRRGCLACPVSVSPRRMPPLPPIHPPSRART